MIAPGELAPVEVGERQYVLCRMLDGTFAFFDGLCTHGRASLADGYLDNCVIECPKHNGRFDVRTGEAVRRPAVQRLGTYPVRVQGGRLVVVVPPTEGQERPAGPAVLSSDRAV
jgi:nitrite reductase/ring-hydroxylating ferredoxin subunit